MSRKPPPSPAPGPNWIAIAVIALFGALFGAGLTFLLLRSRPAPGRAAPAPLSSDPTVHRPSPDLTAGQTPAQAERTLGNFYYDHQNWTLAVQHYEGAIRQGADDADLRTDLGNAYRFAGRPDEALLQYTRAQRLDPAHEFSLFNQGGLYLEAFKQPAKAVEIWQEYLMRFPQGRSADAARQLIAQVTGAPAAAPAGSLPPAPVTSSPPGAAPSSSAAEDLILRQIEAARTKDPKP